MPDRDTRKDELEQLRQQRARLQARLDELDRMITTARASAPARVVEPAMPVARHTEFIFARWALKAIIAAMIALAARADDVSQGRFLMMALAALCLGLLYSADLAYHYAADAQRTRPQRRSAAPPWRRLQAALRRTAMRAAAAMRWARLQLRQPQPAGQSPMTTACADRPQG